jgi:hypothetical protein
MGSIPIARSILRLASGHVGTQNWDQQIDPVGKSWEFASIWGLPHILWYPYVAPAVTRGDFKNSPCDSHTLCAAAIVIAGGRTRPVAASDGRQLLG